MILDTHVWFWWAVTPSRLSRRAVRAIDAADRVGVSAMTVLELVELAERRRIQLDLPLRRWLAAALAHERVELVPLSLDIAADAAQLRFARDPFDRVIYATARATDAPLVTRDERIREFDSRRVIW